LTWPGKVKKYTRNEFTTKEVLEATREIMCQVKKKAMLANSQFLFQVALNPLDV
jgi:hypothetical protein